MVEIKERESDWFQIVIKNGERLKHWPLFFTKNQRSFENTLKRCKNRRFVDINIGSEKVAFVRNLRIINLSM